MFMSAAREKFIALLEKTRSGVWGWVMACGMAYLAVVALTTVPGTGPSAGGNGMFMAGVAFVALGGCYRLLMRKGFACGLLALVSGLALSLASVLGAGITSTGSTAFLAPKLSNLVVATCCFVGFACVYVPMLQALFNRLDRWSMDGASGSERADGGHRPKANRADLASMAKCALVLVALWSPYIILSLPGVSTFDTLYQIAQGSGIKQFTTHHPPFATWVYTLVFKAGWTVSGSTNGGMFGLLVMQVAMLSSAFAWCLTQAKKYKVPTGFRIAALVFWGIVPAFPAFARYLVKDTFACVFFIVFATQLLVRMRLVASKQSASASSSLPALCITGILCCLTRNDTIFVVIPVLLAVAVYDRAARRGIILSAVVVAFSLLTWQEAFIPAMGIRSGKSVEAFSVVVQQTARYAKEHPDDITPGEREAIAGVSDTAFERLGQLYDPYKSDAVKDRFDFDAPGGLSRYLGAWLSMGIRHPGTYVASFLQGTAGYWYPATKLQAHWYPSYVVALQYNGPSIIQVDYWGGIKGEDWKRVYGDIDEPLFPHANAKFTRLYDDVFRMPVFNLFVMPAAFIWIDGVLCAYLLARRRGSGPLVLLFSIKLLICLASPLYASMRYALPLVALTPVLFLAVFMLPRRSEWVEERK